MASNLEAMASKLLDFSSSDLAHDPGPNADTARRTQFWDDSLGRRKGMRDAMHGRWMKFIASLESYSDGFASDWSYMPPWCLSESIMTLPSTLYNQL